LYLLLDIANVNKRMRPSLQSKTFLSADVSVTQTFAVAAAAAAASARNAESNSKRRREEKNKCKKGTKAYILLRIIC
jgi:hypothetical protein